MDLPPIDDAVLLARHELWRRGEIASWKLDSTQQQIYEAIQRGRRKHCLLCSRRNGKSYTLVVIAFETALRASNRRISYASPFGRDASEIATDIAVQIMEDCPDDVRPEYKAATREYVFKNGSTIRFAGLNSEHAQQLRGRAAHLFIVDEMGLVDDLKHVIQDVVLPMTLTTQGRVLFATTPARSPSHQSTTIIKKMMADGDVSVFTIRDNIRVSDEVKAEYLIEAGETADDIPAILAGTAEPKSSTAAREYFCRLDITDADTAVLPEFTAALAKEICIDVQVPPFFDCYVALDPGFNDRTGALFAYWDFAQKKLVIQDEFLLSRATTDDIAYAIEEKEKMLWGARRPLMRVTDLDLRLIADLQQRNGLAFMPGNRQDALGGIDYVRTMLRRREIIISPNCVNLIRQAKHAIWNRANSDFDRSDQDGHFDLIASLRILCRSVVRTKNPYPHWYGAPGYNTSSSAPRKVNKTVFTDTPLGRRLAKKWG